jgi:hypothetical protein
MPKRPLRKAATATQPPAHAVSKNGSQTPPSAGTDFPQDKPSKVIKSKVRKSSRLEDFMT